MWKQKLVLGLNSGFGPSELEQIGLFKAAGFDGYFINWSADRDIAALVEEGKKQGMYLQSMHAPFSKIKHLWGEDEALAREALEEQLACLRDCAKYGAPIMVAHVFIGFKDHTPTPIGIERFSVMVKTAEELGVKIGFENTEGEEYLKAVMDAFKDSPAVGFCWDTGHEMCYNHSKDMTALYGDRLICTHINDNLGIKRFDGEIYYTDDLHLLPFDGIADWKSVAARLDQWDFTDVMTFELTTTSKRDRHDNDRYAAMPIEQYLAEAFNRACRVAALRKVHQ